MKKTIPELEADGYKITEIRITKSIFGFYIFCNVQHKHKILWGKPYFCGSKGVPIESFDFILTKIIFDLPDPTANDSVDRISDKEIELRKIFGI